MILQNGMRHFDPEEIGILQRYENQRMQRILKWHRRKMKLVALLRNTNQGTDR